MSAAPEATVRIDRWLVAARVFKTRTFAQEACSGGKVEVNGSGASPHKPVRIGVRVHATTPRGPRQLVVRALAEKRLSPAAAAELFEDVTPPPPPRIEGLDDPGFASRSGRPSKRDRRHLRELRGR